MITLRQWINGNPALATGALVVVVATAGAYAYRSGAREGRVPLPTFPTTAYYSDDDGSTVFTDQTNKPTPFDHGGRQAFRAHVLSADGGRHRWVGYLEKSGRDRSPSQVKAPGKGNWFQMLSVAGSKVTKVGIPPGMGTGPAQEVQP